MDGAKLSKSLIQFSIERWGSIPSLLFNLRPNYGGSNDDNGNLPVPSTLQQATAHPCFCWGHLDTHRHVWVSLLWGHCSFLLVQRHTRFCFCPPRVCFPSPVLSSGGSMVGLMVTSSKRAYAIRRSAAPRAPAPAAGTLQETLKTQLWLSLCGVYGSWCLQGLFEPSEHLWWIRGLIINAISPLLSSFWGFSFALGHGVSFLVGSNILL